MKNIIIISCACLLSGCAGMKSSFDCNAVAQDSCMTMEEANKKAQNLSQTGLNEKTATPVPSAQTPLPRQLPVPAVRSESPVTVTAGHPVRPPVRTVPLHPVTAGLSVPAAHTAIRTDAVAGTLTSAAVTGNLIAPRPVMTTAQTTVNPPVTRTATPPVSRTDTAGIINDTGITQAVYQPAPTARVWIAGWIDEHDNFFQPSVVSFVVKSGQWAEY